MFWRSVRHALEGEEMFIEDLHVSGEIFSCHVTLLDFVMGSNATPTPRYPTVTATTESWTILGCFFSVVCTLPWQITSAVLLTCEWPKGVSAYSASETLVESFERLLLGLQYTEYDYRYCCIFSTCPAMIRCETWSKLSRCIPPPRCSSRFSIDGTAQAFSPGLLTLTLAMAADASALSNIRIALSGTPARVQHCNHNTTLVPALSCTLSRLVGSWLVFHTSLSLWNMLM